MMLLKKDVYNKLVTKVNNIDTSRLVLKTKYDADKSGLENKIPDTSGLLKKINYNTKITEIEGKIPDISNLATKTVLTTVENKVPDITNLATKAALTTAENKIPDVSNLVKKQTIILKLLILKINLIIMIIINIWILQSNCECECDKNCDIGECLDYENCKCRKKLVDKLIDECSENIEEMKLANITFTKNENNYEHNSCKVYIVFMIIVFIIFTWITVYLVYYNWYLIKNNIFCIKCNTRKKYRNLVSAII